jgi:hypothetical protein
VRYREEAERQARLAEEEARLAGGRRPNRSGMVAELVMEEVQRRGERSTP